MIINVMRVRNYSKFSSAKFKPYGKKANYKKKSSYKKKTRSKRPAVKVAKVDAPKKIATSHWKSTGGELLGKSKPVKGEALGTSIFTKTSTGRVKGTDGGAGQVASLMTAIYPRTDLMAIRNSLNVNANVTFTDVSGVPLYAQPRALLKTATVEHFITNQTNGNVFVDLYEVVSKTDQGLSPEISTQAEITTPLEAFDNGLAANGLGNNFPDRASGGAYTYPGSTTMGVTPNMSQQFKVLWKILKKTTLCLGSGETVQHQSIHKANYLFDYAKTRGEPVATETVEEAYVRGLTVFTMAIVHGQPCDLDADGTVGLTIPEINWTSNVVYRTTAFPASKNTNASFTGGVTSLASGKIFTQTTEATNQPT